MYMLGLFRSLWRGRQTTCRCFWPCWLKDGSSSGLAGQVVETVVVLVESVSFVDRI